MDHQAETVVYQQFPLFSCLKHISYLKDYSQFGVYLVFIALKNCTFDAQNHAKRSPACVVFLLPCFLIWGKKRLQRFGCRFVCGFDRVGVYARGRGRRRVSQTMGNGRDRHTARNL